MTGLIVRCAWCGRYRLEHGWDDLAEPPAGVVISHGICPDCFGVQPIPGTQSRAARS